MAGEKTDIQTVSDDVLTTLLHGDVTTVKPDGKNPLAKPVSQVDLALNPNNTEGGEEEGGEDEEGKDDKGGKNGNDGKGDKNPINSDNLDDLLHDTNAGEEEEESEEEGEPTSTKGKSVFVSALKDLMKEEVILPFELEEGEKEKPIEEFTKKELIDLLKANQKRVKEQAEEAAPREFFDALPEELQYVASYVANGGKELNKVFRHLADKGAVKDIDVKTPEGQEQAIRMYLSATKWGTPEEIEEEVISLKDLPGALEKKANQFKPKLEGLKQQQIDREVKDAELRNKAQLAAVAKYRETVYNTVSAGELNGIKITPSVQNMLFNGLVESVDGIRELLTKANVKTDMAHLSEVFWLLKDPKGYKETLKQAGATESTEDTVRKLKTAADNKKASSQMEQIKSGSAARKGVKRTEVNFFSRK